MEPVKNSGTLSEISCPRLLAYLHRTRFDGTLRIFRGALLKLLYFQGGEIAMASSNDQGDHLAPILIRAGKLKPEQMELARKSTKAGTSLARILVQMGFLTSGELFAGARQQLRQIVGSVLGMTDASYEIQGGYFPREITSLNVDTREMLLELIRDLPDRSFVLLEVGAPDRIYVPVKDSGNGPDGPRLPRAWRDHAKRFSSPLAIHEFGQAANLDDFSASKVVYGLSLLGCVEPQRHEDPSPDATPAPEMVEQAAKEPAAESIPAPEPAVESMTAGATIPDFAPREASSKLPEDVAVAPVGRDVEPMPSFREKFHHGKPSETPSAQIPQPIGSARLEGRAAPGSSSQSYDESAGSGPVHDAGTFVRRETRPLGLNSPFSSELPAVKPSRPWAAASVLGGLCLLAFTSYWFIFLRAPATQAVPSESTPAAPPGRSSEDAVTEDLPSDRNTGGGDSAPPGEASVPQSAREASAGPAPSDLPAASTDSSNSPEQKAASSEDSETGAGESPTHEISIPAAPGGFRGARARLDAGEYAAAARAWSEALAQEASPQFTLQIAIACQEDTLRKAATRTRDSDRFFVLPFTLQGRPCYRLCWGIYSSLESAQSAQLAIPVFFLEEGGRPAVVSLRKALLPEGH